MLKGLSRKNLCNLQLKKFNKMLKEILPKNQFYQEKYGNINPIISMEELLDLPFTQKSELIESQKKFPPYGSFLSYPLDQYVRLHQTSGSTGLPLKILDTKKDWQWFLKCWKMIYHATGIQKNDVLFFAFSFGPFIGFWAGFEGAQQLGNRCLAGGGMTSLARLHSIIDNKATYICCTPTYALRLLEVAEKNNIDVKSSNVRALIVAGEPGGACGKVRETIQEGWNARVFDHTGMTEIGSLGIECEENPGYTHLLESECIAEVIDPNSKESLSEGEIGELVITNLGRWGSPLIRYRTGDLVRLTYQPCKCGSIFCRMIGGINGRKDDMIFIRGNNVYPSAIENIIREYKEIQEFRVEIFQQKEMTEMEIKIEIINKKEEIAKQLSQKIQNQLHFRAKITVVNENSLPRFDMKSKRFVRKNKNT